MKRINISIPEDKLRAIDDNAKKAKMSRSGYMVETCLKNPPVVINGADEIPKILGEIYSKISGKTYDSAFINMAINRISDLFSNVMCRLEEINGSTEDSEDEAEESDDTKKSLGSDVDECIILKDEPNGDSEAEKKLKEDITIEAGDDGLKWDLGGDQNDSESDKL